MKDNNFFYDYVYAMCTLNKLVCQFYSYNISQEEANSLNINYTKNDIFNSFNNVSCVFHRYNPEGQNPVCGGHRLPCHCPSHH